MRFFVLIVLLLAIPLVGKKTYQQESDFLKIKEDAPNVFIDCDYCDMDYIRKEIKFVNYVVEPHKADVYILITRLRTGSGGRKYTLEFTGQGRFEGINDKLFVISAQYDTRDKVREKLVKVLKLGLIQYAKKTKISEFLNVNFTEASKPVEFKDKWNNWVFNLSFGFSKGGEKSYEYEAVNYSANAKRVTEESRIEIGFFNLKRSSIFKMEGTELKSEKKKWNLKSVYVGSISQHFSFGGKVYIDSSTYFNTKRRIKAFPAIEYNFFPYSVATSKILRINYSIGIEDTEYYETTIYGKNRETLLFQAVEGEFESKQKWGEANIGIDFSQYLHDIKKYSLEFSGDLSWRISKGVSFYAYSSYTVIHNQLYLPKGDLTPEEILLRTSALETNYDYSFSFGIRVTFGSIYNNAVNPRFGY